MVKGSGWVCMEEINLTYDLITGSWDRFQKVVLVMRVERKLPPFLPKIEFVETYTRRFTISPPLSLSQRRYRKLLTNE